MEIYRKVISFAEVEQEFVDVHETLDDLSVIRMSLVKDTHDESYDLCVEIFGDGDPDIDAPILDLRIELDAFVNDEKLHTHGISRKILQTMFDSQLSAEIIKRNIPIEWNNGDKTEAVIHISDPGSGFLQAMDR